MNELQPTLFDRPLPFGGKTIDVEIDTPRLTKHLLKVKEIMGDGRWHTIGEVAKLTKCSEAGASARMRDLRKAWAGSHTIERKRVKETGLWVYRMK